MTPRRGEQKKKEQEQPDWKHRVVIQIRSRKNFVFVHPNPLRLKKGAIQDQDKRAWKRKEMILKLDHSCQKILYGSSPKGVGKK